MKWVQRIIGAACIVVAVFFAIAAINAVRASQVAPADVPSTIWILAVIGFSVPTLVMGGVGLGAVLGRGRASDGLLAPPTFASIGLAFLALAILVGLPLHSRIPGRGTIVLCAQLLIAVTSIVTATVRF